MPTALQLGRKNWKAYLKPQRRNQRKAHQINNKQYAELMQQVRETAKRIKSELGATRVILIGSLAHGAWWDEHSDIDLVVEGLKGDHYWKAWAIAEETIQKHHIEVIDIDSATPRFKQNIESKGINV